MSEWWMQSGTTSTAVGANAPLMPGTAAITTNEIASCGVGNAQIADGSVTAGKLGALSVTSEKASANLVKRSASVTVGATSGAGFASTALALWTAPTAAVLTHIRVTPVSPWILATCGEQIEFWACTAGVISLYCTSSTVLCSAVGSVHSTFFTLNSTGVNLAACETVRLKLGLSGTTACAQIGNFQIDYVTSG